MNIYTKLIFLLLSIMAFVSQAATPVTQEYVDEKVAILQAEINQLVNGG